MRNRDPDDTIINPIGWIEGAAYTVLFLVIFALCVAGL